MIKLVFTKGRETFSIEICNKIIFYRDRKLPEGIQFMPEDPGLYRVALLSRNKIPKSIIDWARDANSGKNLEEYLAAKGDESLVPIIKKDAGTHGCTFQKRMDDEEEPSWYTEAIEKLNKNIKEALEQKAKDAGVEIKSSPEPVTT